MIKVAICVVLLLSMTNAINLFNLQMLPKTNGAMCMDGSQYGIYTYIPDDMDVDPENKLMIFFE